MTEDRQPMVPLLLRWQGRGAIGNTMCLLHGEMWVPGVQSPFIEIVVEFT